MNLEKLFKIQAELDKRIVEKHGLQNEDLLDKKILALQVELGELANEWRGFKFWSTDQEPRTELFTTSPLPNEPLVVKRNPLLEEYVDGIHFFISLANDLKINPSDFVVEGDYTKENATETFNEVFSMVSSVIVLMDVDVPATITMKEIQEVLHEAFSCYVGLAEKFLDFTWEQIEHAYLDKNKINHTRQDSGY